MPQESPKVARIDVIRITLTCIGASVIGFSSKDFFCKNYSGAPGGPSLVIFGIMVHDPLYFELGIFLGQTDPHLYV